MKTKKPKAARIPGDGAFGAGGVLAVIGLILFFVGQSPLSMIMIISGILLAILGKLQTIAWNTAPQNRTDS